ncbi:hypothetical protein RS3R6_42470 [Pseudomonas atacamensis]|jgi:hypothetical protein|uniref:Uncharacterized protein n=1 Tax=Pseudomonas atacamensis TaxID=2565368 RepID=A0ABQ5PPU8_9PSED|nr:hypothetical protein RS3R1_46670 [Pseudomonas atacamensis]GLH56065.1 hypothetical protein RS3R6_42470 [Pseudomonas atacamensis]
MSQSSAWSIAAAASRAESGEGERWVSVTVVPQGFWRSKASGEAVSSFKLQAASRMGYCISFLLAA